jgi:hypothetical protein
MSLLTIPGTTVLLHMGSIQLHMCRLVLFLHSGDEGTVAGGARRDLRGRCCCTTIQTVPVQDC